MEMAQPLDESEPMPAAGQSESDATYLPRPEKDVLVDHYTATRSKEQSRLEADFLGRAEKARTLSLLRLHLPPPPAKIADIGGAAGAYSFDLAELGYDVHLKDLVPLHIEQAERVNEGKTEAQKLKSMTVGDARDLSGFEEETFDAVLELGPLYHLQRRDDRIRALREAHRVLKPGGLVACAAVPRLASFLDGLDRDFLLDPDFRKIVEGDLATGNHDNPTRKEEYWTTAYLHRPEELRTELLNGGFEDVTVVAVEGPLWAIHEGSELQDEARIEKLFQLLEKIETDPAVVGTSPHILAFGTKTATEETTNEPQTVEQMMDAFHLAASRADAETYFGFFAQDAYFIGTDATERWSVEEFRRYAMPIMSQGKGWTYRPTKRSVSYSSDRKIAWFDEALENERFGVTRSSGVAIREDGQWKVAQYHLTVPIPNNLMDRVVAMIRSDGRNEAAGSGNSYV